MDTYTAKSLTKQFINSRQYVDVANEDKWLTAIFGCMLKVAKSQRTFIVDDVWEQIESLISKKKLPSTRLDPRIIGVMLRFLTSQGVIYSSGYYAKSDRPGSRPVTVWESDIYRARAAA